MIKNIKVIGLIVVGSMVILAVVNHFIRISDGYESCGYIEELLFNEPIKKKFDKLMFSDNYVLYEDVNERLFYISGIIEKHGSEIFDNINYESKRIEAINILEHAITNCSKIPDDYLFDSNPELPEKYRKHFQNALMLWHAGLENKQTEALIKGNREYNIFLSWIQSKSRNDFKNLR